MSASLRFRGLDELRAALKALPRDLTADAAREIDTAGRDTAAAIADAYPIGKTGRLRGGVSVRRLTTGPYAARTQVRSDAPYANAYESGTTIRTTRAGHNRGRVTAHPTAIPVLIRVRARLQETLIAIVKQAGLVIRG